MMDSEVPVVVGEKTYKLALTLAAMEKINAQFGSLMEARQRVQLYDFSAICGVIAAGANLSPEQSKTLRSEVFSAGIVNVSAEANVFVIRLFDPEGRGDEESDSGEA
jgi:hypothetical protein